MTPEMGRLDFPEILTGEGSAHVGLDLVPTMLPFPSLGQTELLVFPGSTETCPTCSSLPAGVPDVPGLQGGVGF